MHTLKLPFPSYKNAYISKYGTDNKAQNHSVVKDAF